MDRVTLFFRCPARSPPNLSPKFVRTREIRTAQIWNAIFRAFKKISAQPRATQIFLPNDFGHEFWFYVNCSLKFCGGTFVDASWRSTKFQGAIRPHQKVIRVQSAYIVENLGGKLHKNCALFASDALKTGCPIWAVWISRVRANFGLRFGGDLI